MTLDWRNIITAAGAASVFSALTVILGRFWTESYYRVFGLPTSDLHFDVMDYAFRTKEVLLMLTLAALIGGVLSLFKDARDVFKPPPPALGLNRLGIFTLAGALAGLGLLALLAIYKPSHFDWLWKVSGVLGLMGGLFLGLAIGVLGVVARDLWKQGKYRWSALPAALIVALVVVFVPWSTGEMAEFKAIRDLRTGELPQAIIEFRQEAPAAIRRSDDPTKTQLVRLVLATGDRLAIAHPFGCSCIGEPKEPPDGNTGGKPLREICDIFTFDREDVRGIRIFGKGTDRPFNDERTNPLVVDLLGDGTPFDQDLDLTAARKDRCGDQSDDIGDARGVWLQLNALQSGRVSFQERPSRLYLSPEDRSNECTKLVDGMGIELHVDDKLMVLAAAPPDDRILTPLRFTFVPREFRSDDVYVGEKKDTDQTIIVPFLVQNRSLISVIVDVDGMVPAAPECIETETTLAENDQREITPVQVGVAPSDSTATVSLSPDEYPQRETGPTSVAFTVDQPLEPGRWDLSLSGSCAIRSFRIILSSLPTEDLSQEEQSEERQSPEELQQ